MNKSDRHSDVSSDSQTSAISAGNGSSGHSIESLLQALEAATTPAAKRNLLVSLGVKTNSPDKDLSMVIEEKKKMRRKIIDLLGKIDDEISLMEAVVGTARCSCQNHLSDTMDACRTQLSTYYCSVLVGIQAEQAETADCPDHNVTAGSQNNLRVDNAVFRRHIQEKTAKFIEKAGLSEQEKKVFQYLCQGAIYESIAEQMSITSRTVKFHAHNVFKKVGAESYIDLIRILNKLWTE